MLPSGWTFPDYLGQGNAVYIDSPNGFYTRFTTNGNPTSGVISVRAVNECGLGGAKNLFVSTQNCENALIEVSASPNPANQTLTISPVNNQQQKNTEQAQANLYTYKLFDKQGNILRQGKSNAQYEAVIDTRSIPSDNYFLHIIYPKETVKKQVIVQH